MTIAVHFIQREKQDRNDADCFGLFLSFNFFVLALEEAQFLTCASGFAKVR